MAQERPRTPRARTTKAGEPGAAAEKPAKRTRASARTLKTAPTPTPDEIAEKAYLLWESGEPGDETAHWLRAEAELRAA
jgi:hypothetical protein